MITATVLFFMSATAETPRYIFMNQAPGIVWDQHRPETFTRAGFDDVVQTLHAPENQQLRVGISFFFSLLIRDLPALQESVRRLLALAEETGVPVLITFDGQQWWEERPDLWNWWDPAKPGYDPENAKNVEWTDWDATHAVKIGWRNWGSQIRVAPAPSISSPRFVQANLDALDAVVPIIADFYRRLPNKKRYLLGGVKVGNEAGTGYNAFYYANGNRYIEQWPDDASHDPQAGLHLENGLAGGVAQIGYAAVRTAGIKKSGDLTREDMGEVTRRYLATLAQRVHALGIPKSIIFTHQGGTYAPWDVHLPFWPAFNHWSSPGWSFYGVDPNTAGDMGKELDKARSRRWAAAEWWWGGATEAEWLDHFERTLRFRDCRFIAVYNWDCGFSFKNNAAGQAALRTLISRWR